MKSVLISIQPKWCELIASGKKTVEVRKTKPKLEVPFKCYIYCTHNNRKYAQHLYINSGYGKREFGIAGHWRSGKDVVDVNSHLPAYRFNAYLAEGKVIGEFVCDKVIWVLAHPSIFAGHPLFYTKAIKDACLTEGEVEKYSEGKDVYGWHITDLVIYDKPKDLSEFRYHCRYEFADGFEHCNGCDYYYFSNTPSNGREEWCICGGLKRLTRPPQNWCYVEGR